MQRTKGRCEKFDFKVKINYIEGSKHNAVNMKENCKLISRTVRENKVDRIYNYKNHSEEERH